MRTSIWRSNATFRPKFMWKAFQNLWHFISFLSKSRFSYISLFAWKSFLLKCIHFSISFLSHFTLVIQKLNLNVESCKQKRLIWTHYLKSHLSSMRLISNNFIRFLGKMRCEPSSYLFPFTGSWYIQPPKDAQNFKNINNNQVSLRISHQHILINWAQVLLKSYNIWSWQLVVTKWIPLVTGQKGNSGTGGCGLSWLEMVLVQPFLSHVHLSYFFYITNLNH